MSKRAWKDMLDKIEWEGFDYYFSRYTSYESCGVVDEKLRKLWKKYKEAAKELEAYVESKRR